jgi:hypothetical protein
LKLFPLCFDPVPPLSIEDLERHLQAWKRGEELQYLRACEKTMSARLYAETLLSGVSLATVAE